MVVLAGPGTGKTRVLTHRVVRLVDKRLVSPHGVLAVTFTRKAAAEMRQRVQLLLGYDVGELNISTIHSLAYRILSVGTRRSFLPILDAGDAFKVLKRAALEVGLDDRLWDRGNLFREIQQAKGRLVGPEQYVQVPGSYFEEHVARVYQRYQQLLEQDNKFDMSDLVLKAVRLLDRNSSLLSHLRALSPFVLVDEFQDTSMSQYQLLKLLAEKSRNLFVVVSPAQGLYEWRGAYADRLLEAVREDFSELREITLERNYRSSGTIVAASKAVIGGDGRYPDADLTPVRNRGVRVVVSRLSSPDDVAAMVVARARELYRTGTRWGDIAVLYRTHRQAYVLEKHLADANIPYGSQNKLYQRPEVQQILAYLRLAHEPREPGPLDVVVNVPPRGIGPNSLRRIKQGDVHLTVEHLSQTVASGMDRGLRNQVVEGAYDLLELVGNVLPQHANLPPEELIQLVLDHVGLGAWLQEEFDGRRRLAGIRRVQSDAAEFADLPSFLEYARERSDGFLSSDRGIQLSTIHAAKGLEFDVVFIVGLEEGMLPHAKALKRAQDPLEERRLCYVAMTRARDELYMLCSRAGSSHGWRRSRGPSRYFGDLPSELVRRVG